MLLKPIDGTEKIRLQDCNPDDTADLTKEEAEAQFEKLTAELSELQDLLYAAQETPLLIVLQGMDTSGKDGAIRHVIGAMNPQSCHIASFKVPTAVELAHDFLWRIHAETPGRGQVTVFNRSHYEDVVVVRVKKLVPEKVWKARFQQINQFESLLTDNGTLLLKFFLNISKEEQEERLHAREQDTTKAWKLSAEDWKNREFWDGYQVAYEDAINRCATPHAPWYVVPANKKWFRNLAVAEAIVETLRPLREGWMRRLSEIGAEELKELHALRQKH
jgi:PPK2 family polyphosphate:nucleotide phosphotransferase